MTSPEVPTKRTLTPELRDEIARRMAEKTFKKSDYERALQDTPQSKRTLEHEKIVPKYINTGPERYTQTDFGYPDKEDSKPDVSDEYLLKPLPTDPNKPLRIHQYISEINDAHQLTTEQYMQLMNRLLRLQCLGLIERSLNGIYRLENKELTDE